MSILCLLDGLAVKLAYIYTFILLIYAVLSWIPDLRGPWVRYIAKLVEPVLTPLRRVIPPLGGLDMSFLVFVLLLQMVIIPLLRTAALNACFAL